MLEWLSGKSIRNGDDAPINFGRPALWSEGEMIIKFMIRLLYKKRVEPTPTGCV